MTNFITNLILISSLLSISAAFTASLSNVERRFVTEERNPTARFYTNNACSYDIGIGKNHPLLSDFTRNPDDDAANENDVYEAAQFMVQHESVHKFPSPLDTQQEQHHQEAGREDKLQKQDKRSSLPMVEPKRQLEDVLFILTEDDLNENSSSRDKLASNTSSRHPVIIQHSKSREIDINSIWVEMLIHHQQKTAMAALQTA